MSHDYRSISAPQKKHLSRRTFLRGAGIALTLPVFDAMRPAFVHAEPAAPKRFVAMCTTLGIHTPHLFPKETGRGYTPSPYLAALKDLRDDFTVFSGMGHHEQNGANGHTSEMTWLTGSKHPGLAGFRNTISIDQLIAQRIGTQTRFPYLALTRGSGSLSWTASGAEIPGESAPSKVFQQLFVQGTDDEMKAQLRGIQRGRSILDTVNGEAKKLRSDLGKRDQDKLDQYLTSVRDLESRLVESQDWVTKPKPKVSATAPKDIADSKDISGRSKLMNDVIVLALQTDSTRTVTFKLSGMNQVPIVQGVSHDWHNLSHHGQDPAKIEELKLIELAEFHALRDFLAKLKSVQENGRSLLDNTNVLFGSNLGNASAHDTHNLPLILAGGGFKHGQHLAFDQKNNLPLSNLFVQLLHRMGVETDRFGYNTAASVTGLEAV
ncbi:MAG: DUF1552 domain-containing protein [Planctomycetota bacterium]